MNRDEWKALAVVAAVGCAVVLVAWLTGWATGCESASAGCHP